MTYPKKDADDFRIQQVESAYEAYIKSPKYVKLENRGLSFVELANTVDRNDSRLLEDAFHFEKIDDNKYKIFIYVLDISELAAATSEFVDQVKNLSIPLSKKFKSEHFNMLAGRQLLAREISFEAVNEGVDLGIDHKTSEIKQVVLEPNNNFSHDDLSEMMQIKSNRLEEFVRFVLKLNKHGQFANNIRIDAASGDKRNKKPAEIFTEVMTVLANNVFHHKAAKEEIPVLYNAYVNNATNGGSNVRFSLTPPKVDLKDKRTLTQIAQYTKPLKYMHIAINHLNSYDKTPLVSSGELSGIVERLNTGMDKYNYDRDMQKKFLTGERGDAVVNKAPKLVETEKVDITETQIYKDIVEKSAEGTMTVRQLVKTHLLKSTKDKQQAYDAVVKLANLGDDISAELKTAKEAAQLLLQYMPELKPPSQQNIHSGRGQ
jgi:RNA binding exosome subunit